MQLSTNRGPISTLLEIPLTFSPRLQDPPSGEGVIGGAWPSGWSREHHLDGYDHSPDVHKGRDEGET
jgi:hypothetical protein